MIVSDLFFKSIPKFMEHSWILSLQLVPRTTFGLILYCIVWMALDKFTEILLVLFRYYIVN